MGFLFKSNAQKMQDAVDRLERERAEDDRRILERHRAFEAELSRISKLEKEQARQAKEQERQAAQLARHEEQLAKLEQRLALAEREIAHYKPQLDRLKAREEELDNRVWYLSSIGLPSAGIQKELDRVREKAYQIETKVIKAEYDRDNAQRRMAQ